MVSNVFHPLNIFIVGLGGAFLIPLVYRFGRNWLPGVFVLALAAMADGNRHHRPCPAAPRCREWRRIQAAFPTVTEHRQHR